MLRQQVLSAWNALKAKFTQLKAKSIDNYPIVTKRAILGLDNQFSNFPLTLCDFTVVKGEVETRKINWSSKQVIEVHTELLKVIILDVIEEKEEEYLLKNYEGEIDYSQSEEEGGPTLEEVD